MDPSYYYQHSQASGLRSYPQNTGVREMCILFLYQKSGLYFFVMILVQ